MPFNYSLLKKIFKTFPVVRHMQKIPPHKFEKKKFFFSFQLSPPKLCDTLISHKKQKFYTKKNHKARSSNHKNAKNFLFLKTKRFPKSKLIASFWKISLPKLITSLNTFLRLYKSCMNMEVLRLFINKKKKKKKQI